jgi:hypothetical protein
VSASHALPAIMNSGGVMNRNWRKLSYILGRRIITPMSASQNQAINIRENCQPSVLRIILRSSNTLPIKDKITSGSVNWIPISLGR